MKKYQRPQEEVICCHCGKSFLKDGSEIRRNKKIGRKNYCSLNCANKANKDKHGKGNPEFLIADNRKDKYTGIREHLRRVKNRYKESGKEYDITLDDLLEQWEKQNHICPYIGVELFHPTTKNKKNYTLLRLASLDRIDSCKGYVKGNIQFVSAMANLAKNNLSHNEMVEFCMLIAKQWVGWLKINPLYSTKPD